MATRAAAYPRIRLLGLAIALVLSAVVIVSLVLIASGLNDEESEAAEVSRLVETMAAESGAVTNGYLAAPESAGQITAGFLRLEDASPENLTTILADVTATHANVVGAFVGYPDGGFVDVRRSDEVIRGGFRIKEIRIDEVDGRTVDLTFTDDMFEPLESIRDESDEYDPRARPWFESVIEGDDVSWTDPYIFFTSQKPGITHSVAVRSPDGMLEAVVGIDVELDDLNGFLAQRRPSVNGSAVVIDRAGTVIATSDPVDPEGNEPADPETVALLEAVPELAGEVDGFGPSVIRWTEGEPRAVAAQPVGSTTDWLLVVEAPEEDFLQDVRGERRRYAIIAAVVGLASTLMFLGAAVWITRHFELLRRLAQIDDLTGALNHDAARRELEKALTKWRGRGGLSAMIVDLDDFKSVNDELGHEVGDPVLVAVAERLGEAAGPDALVGRLGVDEFLVVVPHPPEGRRDTAQVLRGIVDQLALPLEVGGLQLDLTVSAGYTTQTARDAKDAAEMLTEADVALFEAKADKQHSLLRFHESMQLNAARNHRRQTELEAAIHRNEFVLSFRPEFSLVNDRLVGAETVWRWEHPTLGLLESDEFLGDLERFGLLHRLLPKLIDESADLAWYYTGSMFTIRLALAAEQLSDPHLLPLLESAVERCPDVSINLLLPERSVLEAPSPVLVTLTRLRELGVKIVLDDFGTGQSAHRGLQGLPVSGIKIAPAFVAELDNADPPESIAAMLVALADEMNVDAMADGVETAEQCEALEAIGCVRAQGDLLGPPIPADEFLAIWEPGRTFSSVLDAA